MLDLEAFAGALGLHADIDYYALTSRVPDFALDRVDAAERRARVRCLDAMWPDGAIACRVETASGSEIVEVALRNGEGTLRWKGEAKRIEVDPDRVLLDPIRSNNVWTR